MNRKQYQDARRLIRDNGRYALRLVPEMVAVCVASYAKDYFAERADIVAWCAREGVACTPAQTAVFPEVLARWQNTRSS